MIAKSFVQNAWYVAGMSVEFATDQLHGVVIAKRPIVIWRTGEGTGGDLAEFEDFQPRQRAGSGLGHH